MAIQRQSLLLVLASPMSGLANRKQMIPLYNAKSTPRFQRNASLQVRCLAEEDDKKEQVPTATPELKPNPSPAPKAPKPSTKISDVFAFSGPAPERINGRLAMVGFVAALAVELSKGQDVFTQIDPVVRWDNILFSVASLISLFQGVTVESKSGDIMSSDAEL